METMKKTSTSGFNFIEANYEVQYLSYLTSQVKPTKNVQKLERTWF